MIDTGPKETKMASIHPLETRRVANTKRRAKLERRPPAPVVFDSWADEEASVVSSDALDVIARTATAAFAVDPSDRIIYWNKGAEKLLGRTAENAIGLMCHDVLKGSDPFGNLYCTAQCPIMSLMKVGTTAAPFCLDVERAEPNRLKVRMQTVAYPKEGTDFTALVHLLDVNDDQRLEKLVAELRETAKGITIVPLPEGTPNPLTTREREIVDLLSNGFAALNIAARLNLSHATVRNHIQNILRKLEVHSQVEAIAVSFRNHWI
ncbi:MAG: LuxR C-terminal-related transcriptional regulator [Thermoanaerobaculia bacterium]